MDSLINQPLVDELVKRQIAEEKFMPKPDVAKQTKTTEMSPKVALLLGSLADSASTYGFLKQGGRHETNPAMQFFNGKPWSVIPTAAASTYGYNKLYDVMNKNHPKIANMVAGLVGGWHGAAAGNNVEHSPVDSVVSDLRLKGTR